MQRALAHEAIGKLRAAGEYFGAERDRLPTGTPAEDFDVWNIQIDRLERWLWDESPIA